jgi:hypothetical protein
VTALLPAEWIRDVVATPPDPVLAALQRVVNRFDPSTGRDGTPVRALSLTDFRKRYGAESQFLAFCSLLEIKVKDATAEHAVRLDPTPIQRRYSAARTARDTILKSRQVKITTIELARDIWFWLTKRGVNVRVVCQSSSRNEMIDELSERIELMIDSLRRNCGLVLDLAVETKANWELRDGGATLKLLAAGASATAADKSGRGPTIHRLHTTEIAVWEYAGRTLNAMLEAVPDAKYGSEIVHESTPNGAGGENREAAKDASGGPTFYWLCQDAGAGRSDFKLHFFSWLEEPEYRTSLEPGETIVPETDRERAVMALGATPEQLKWYRAKVLSKGQDDTDQEYPSDPQTCFLVEGRSFFDKDVTERLRAACREPIETTKICRSGAVGTLRIWHLPEPGKTYVLSADTSEGTGGNRGGGQVWERGTGRHCATLVGQIKPQELAGDLATLGYRYNTALLAVERNNHGHAVLQELQRVSVAESKKAYPNLFHDADKKPGWNTTPVSRPVALDTLEQAHRTGIWITRDVELVGELRTFVVDKDGRAGADRGAQDDLVMMAAIGWGVLTKHVRVIPRGMGSESLGLF